MEEAKVLRDDLLLAGYREDFAKGKRVFVKDVKEVL
jgi:hypothetical protein